MGLKFSKLFSIIYCGFLISLFVYIKPAFAIKVGLITNAKSAVIAVSKYGTFIDGHTGQKISSINPMAPYSVSRNGATICVNINGKPYDLKTNYLVVKAEDGGFIFTKKRWYRGIMLVIPAPNGVTVINELDMEDYLLGVVPSEMPRSWNIEAHKAQAIAARSYAIANLGKRAKSGYDLKDTPEDQAYGGATAESRKTTQAVMETKGEVMVYGNKVIPAYYHASSGGYTVNSGDVWVKDLPFVRAVPAFDGNIRKNGHGVGMSQHGANILANHGYNAYQILGYFYQNVRLFRINKRI